jgi:AcrR family transcriptional regulator
MPTHRICEGIFDEKQDITHATTHLFAEHGFEGTKTG